MNGDAHAAWRATAFAFTLPDEPGALAIFAARLRAADVNLHAIWGHGDPELAGEAANFVCIPENAEQFRNFADSASLHCRESVCFFIGSTDEPGALRAILEAIGNRGINLTAIQAIAIGREYGCFMQAEPADWEALSELLGCDT